MTRRHGPSLVGRLFAMTSFLLSIANVAPVSASAQELPASSQLQAFTSSAAATGDFAFAQDIVQPALNEISAALDILNNPELDDDPALTDYLEALEQALDRYEHGAGSPAARARSLATALAMARTALLDQIGKLSAWLSVYRVGKGADEQGYIVVPDRFIGAPVSIDFEESPTLEEIKNWFELDDYEA